MSNELLTFNDLPQVVAELRDEVSGMKALLLNLQNRPTQQRENRHRPVTPKQVYSDEETEITKIVVPDGVNLLLNFFQRLSY